MPPYLEYVVMVLRSETVPASEPKGTFLVSASSGVNGPTAPNSPGVCRSSSGL